MSGEGGDTGGGGYSGGDPGGDSGGGGKGSSGSSDSGGGGKGGDSNIYAPPGDVADYGPQPVASGGGGGGSDPMPYSPSGGGSSGLPPEITTGQSDPGASMWSGPSINDFMGPGSDGLNLGGSGPVGGDSGLPGAGGGINTPYSVGTYSSDASSALPSLDTSAGAAPSLGSASAFSAPEGVGGSPQLDSLLSEPQAMMGPISPADQNVFESLSGAQTATANQYADVAAPNIPSAEGGSTTLPAAAMPTGAGGGSSGGGGNSQTTGILPGVSNNTLGVGASAIGLLNNLINGKQPLAAQSNLNGNATNANAVSAQQNEHGVALQQYVATGKLPDGLESQVQQAAQSAKQTIISNYAARGLPTDPTRNSSLAQELAQVDSRLPAMREQIAGELAKTGAGMVSAGLTAAGISSGVYQSLANIENDQNKQRGAAIANFAAALNSGTRPATKAA